MKTDYIVRSCALAIVLLLAFMVFRPMEPVKAAGNVRWQVIEMSYLGNGLNNNPGTVAILQKMSDDGWQYAGSVKDLRVPICEGWRLMPPSWFLRFWISRAVRG
jgi:hypothetical protein